MFQMAGVHAGVLAPSETPLSHSTDSTVSSPGNLLSETRSLAQDTFTLVSSADLFQIAGALAVHECGGPWVPIRVGRLQVSPACSRVARVRIGQGVGVMVWG